MIPAVALWALTRAAGTEQRPLLGLAFIACTARRHAAFRSAFSNYLATNDTPLFARLARKIDRLVADALPTRLCSRTGGCSG